VITITLPWPDRVLSPNDRPHWAAKARAVRSARIKAWAHTKVAFGAKYWHSDHGDIYLDYVFNPPDRRARDEDSLISSMKAHRDGIADALRVNDVRFRQGNVEIGEVIKGGRVVITIREG
jgi:crossover junction endodeoxyribonuclease RusA